MTWFLYSFLKDINERGQRTEKWTTVYEGRIKKLEEGQKKHEGEIVQVQQNLGAVSAVAASAAVIARECGLCKKKPKQKIRLVPKKEPIPTIRGERLGEEQIPTIRAERLVEETSGLLDGVDPNFGKKSAETLKKKPKQPQQQWLLLQVPGQEQWRRNRFRDTGDCYGCGRTEYRHNYNHPTYSHPLFFTRVSISLPKDPPAGGTEDTSIGGEVAVGETGPTTNGLPEGE